MFFKPNFCCNCGEKIQRADWGLTTSRRFCDVCSIENKGHELLPRVIVAAAVLLGMFGFGSCLTMQNTGQMVSLKTLPPTEQQRPAREDRTIRPVEQQVAAGEPAARALKSEQPAAVTGNHKEQLGNPRPATEEAVYYCGAMTKKGRPCSRRVKTKGRCWQHQGQPSMLAPSTQPDVY